MTFGLALEVLDNLRLAASEDLDMNCWGDGGAIFREENQALLGGGVGWGGVGRSGTREGTFIPRAED